MQYPDSKVVDPGDLPTLPEQTWQIIQACARPEVDARALAGRVSRDPVLSAELLKLVNSAYFGYAKPVSSIARAVTLIGYRALRNLVLSLSIRKLYRADELPAFPLESFWEASILRAAAARNIAAWARLDEDTGFTAGLLMDFGLLVLFHLNQQRICEWSHLAQCLPDERYELERQLFGLTHDQVGMQLVGAWGLPDELTFPLGFHHQQAPLEIPPQTGALSRVLACADWVAAVFAVPDKRPAILRCQSLLADSFGLGPDQCNELLDLTSRQLSEVARLYGVRSDEPIDLHQVLQAANLRLAEENLSYQELTWRLEQALEERDRVAAALHQELELAREVQRSLLPMDHPDLPYVAGLNLSAGMMSGDFYDFLPLTDGELAFCIADVSGKGMHAALLMSKASSLFRFFAKHLQQPARILALLNQEIIETSIRGMFVSMIVGLFRPAAKRVVLANAGHLPALRMQRNGCCTEYPATAPPLGVLPQVAFSEVEFELGEHSLYLCTDGLMDAWVSDHRRLGRDGLERLFLKYSGAAPTARLQQIVGDLQRHSVRVDDDLTLLLLDGQAVA
jgi:HD-like signal output (HDOD) protein/serine phosphatase RsbU (regulator of sigma subunit)